MDDLRRIFPDHRHLELSTRTGTASEARGEGVAGFTNERIEELTLRKRQTESGGMNGRGGVGRSVSDASASTGVSDLSGSGSGHASGRSW